MYLNAEGSKNKRESKGFSTIYKSLSVKVNSRPLSLVSCSGCFNLITRRSSLVRINFSTKLTSGPPSPGGCPLPRLVKIN